MKIEIRTLTLAAITAWLTLPLSAAIVYPDGGPNGDGIVLPESVPSLTSYSQPVEFTLAPSAGGGTFVPDFSLWVTGSTYLNEGTTASFAPVLQLQVNGGAWTNLLTLEAFTATDTNDANDRPNSASPTHYFGYINELDPDTAQIAYQYNLPALMETVSSSGGVYSYRVAVTASNVPDSSFEIVLTGPISQSTLDLKQYDSQPVTGTFTPVPEPGSAMLLLAASALLTRRKRARTPGK
jgi:hypothetical protein